MIALLSGVSGSGKTTVCKAVAETAQAGGIPTGGIVCGAVFELGLKTGIQWADLAAGSGTLPVPLARVRAGLAGRKPGQTSPAFDDSDPHVLRYGMWEFSKLALEEADNAIVSYTGTHCGPDSGGNTGQRPPIIIVDEIGPLELDRGTGLRQTLAMLDKAARLPEADGMFLVVARPDIAARLIERWPGSVKVDITRTGNDCTAETIFAVYNQQLK